MQTHFVPTPDGRVHSILLVDDDPDSAFLLKRDLAKVFPEAEIRAVPSSLVSQWIAYAVPDLLVSSYRLQGATGPELISHLRETGQRFPIVMISGMTVYRDQALKSGATLFLTYDDVHQLASELRPLLDRRPPISGPRPASRGSPGSTAMAF